MSEEKERETTTREKRAARKESGRAFPVGAFLFGETRLAAARETRAERGDLGAEVLNLFLSFGELRARAPQVVRRFARRVVDDDASGAHASSRGRARARRGGCRHRAPLFVRGRVVVQAGGGPLAAVPRVEHRVQLRHGRRIVRTRSLGPRRPTRRGWPRLQRNCRDRRDSRSSLRRLGLASWLGLGPARDTRVLVLVLALVLVAVVAGGVVEVIVRRVLKRRRGRRRVLVLESLALGPSRGELSLQLGQAKLLLLERAGVYRAALAGGLMQKNKIRILIARKPSDALPQALRENRSLERIFS